MESTKRIVVADTGIEFRKNLIRALSEEPDFQIVGETEDGSELMRMIQRDQPDAVVMDMVLTGGMDGMDVLDAISRLRERPKVQLYQGQRGGRGGGQGRGLLCHQALPDYRCGRAAAAGDGLRRRRAGAGQQRQPGESGDRNHS